jgi:Ca-activated chloride channel family protein
MNARKSVPVLLMIGALLLASCAAAPRGGSVRAPTAAPAAERLAYATREAVVEEEVAAAEPTAAPAEPAPIAVAPAESGKGGAPDEAAGRRATAAPTEAPAGREEMPPTPPADTTFEDYGVNPYVDARRDHLSTFALDVDTASYAVARTYVMDGNLPPYESVRVEEFINYFDQGYALPRDANFAIYADGAPSPFHRDDSYLVRIGIQGYDIPEADRKPASLTFVIDVSGSMAQGERLEIVKHSLELLVDRLRSDDTVGIVAFTTRAYIVLEPTSARNQRAILAAIAELYPQNSTNVDDGLRLGYQLADETYRRGAINRVILCSDGVANTGTTNPDALVEFVRGYSDRISLTSIGVGMGNFNDVLMEQLADKGNGFYAYVDTYAEAEKLFLERLTGTLQTIARDAKVQVDFNPEVVDRYRLLGYENRAVADRDFRNDAVDAGELGAGHTATAVYAVQLHPRAEGRVATVQLRWEDPDTGKVSEINGNFNTFDLAARYEDTDPRYQLTATVAQYAEILRLSPYARDTTLRELRPYADDVARALRDDPDVQEFADLVTRAARLR